MSTGGLDDNRGFWAGVQEDDRLDTEGRSESVAEHEPRK